MYRQLIKIIAHAVIRYTLILVTAYIRYRHSLLLHILRIFRYANGATGE